MVLFNRHKRFKFTERHHSVKGMIASAVSAAVLAGYVVIVLLAFRTDGALSAYYGSAGICLFLLAVWMIILSVQSLSEEDSYPLFPRLSLLLSVLAALCWAGTYAAGLGIL